MIKIFYPRSNKRFTSLNFSSDKIDVKNGFPRYSISVYDDDMFAFKRQSINGSQILSNILSDDYYPLATDTDSKTKYEIGESENLKIFYIKILVYQGIPNEVESEYSVNFYLSKTQVFGDTFTTFYPIKCYEKKQNYTVYTSAISIKVSDFLNTFDGKIFLVLTGDYNVELNYPVSLTISNAASTSLAQVSNTTPRILAASANGAKYFNNVIANFNYIEYSNNFDYDFVYIDITLPTSVFSTNSILLSSSTSDGVFIRFTFGQLYTISSFDYFGLTIRNEDLDYNPEVDTLFRLIFFTQTGEKLSVENCKILNNSVSGFYDIIFNFKNISNSNEYLNYFILEIRSLNALTDNYEISYMNFMEANSAGAFFVQKLTSNNDYTTVNFSSLDNGVYALKLNSAVKSLELFNLTESLIETEGDIVYEIKTDSFAVRLVENTQVKTNKFFVPVQFLNTNSILTTISGDEQLRSIKVYPPSKVLLIDTFENADYVLNGFYIKNPVFIKDFNRIMLALGQDRYVSDLLIGKQSYLFIKNTSEYSYFSNIITLQADQSHEISFQKNVIGVSILLDAKSEIFIKSENKQKLPAGRHVLNINTKKTKKIAIKSKDKIDILKMMLKYEI